MSLAASHAPLPARILVAEDEPRTREFVATVLRRHGLNVDAVEDGQEAIARATRGDIDLVILDAVMPRLGGFEACRMIKAATAGGFLPIILVTVKNDTSSRVAGLHLGADDYIGKPFDERELMARVSSLLRVKRLHDELAAAKRSLEELAVRDELTGLHNYRYLRTRADDEFKRATRYHDPLTCIMIDIDHFKLVNDAHGHAIGDRVLVEVARRLQTGVREVDVLARYGGEEFLLLLPSTPHDGGLLVAQRLRQSVAATPVSTDGQQINVTVSCGVANVPHSSLVTKEALLKAADMALYRAKAEGRNRVCAHADATASHEHPRDPNEPGGKQSPSDGPLDETG
ncbi:MAG: diguanylate cyclase [Myxococcales bacterium FL481]|nr:MAG: diguanylate cyclase [Myxococcales bacterium FL481]